ncbi:hypothetical protein Scep_027435 [Stephania cephalantha]|uniref:Uncharacterized protein n=1 Tax=Stephania cephalantha TaxID=152367 RepID=A0AAP0EB73_9MAGN
MCFTMGSLGSSDVNKESINSRILSFFISFPPNPNPKFRELSGDLGFFPSEQVGSVVVVLGNSSSPFRTVVLDSQRHGYVEPGSVGQCRVVADVCRAKSSNIVRVTHSDGVAIKGKSTDYRSLIIKGSLPPFPMSNFVEENVDTPVENYWCETTQGLEVLQIELDMPIAPNDDDDVALEIGVISNGRGGAADRERRKTNLGYSFVLEVPNELRTLKDGMHAALPKAIDAPFVVDISKGEGIT